MAAREVLILGGPNGAGKTTSSAVLVPGMRFLNSDVIAARMLAEGRPPTGAEVAAGHEVLQAMHAATEARVPFCVETNLAGRGLLR